VDALRLGGASMGKVWEMRPVLNNMNRALDDLDKSKDTALQDMVTTHRKTAANWNAAINFCGNYIAAAKESKDRSKLHHDEWIVRNKGDYQLPLVPSLPPSRLFRKLLRL
jgi:hypothetical protein